MDFSISCKYEAYPIYVYGAAAGAGVICLLAGIRLKRKRCVLLCGTDERVSIFRLFGPFNAIPSGISAHIAVYADIQFYVYPASDIALLWVQQITGDKSNQKAGTDIRKSFFLYRSGNNNFGWYIAGVLWSCLIIVRHQEKARKPLILPGLRAIEFYCRQRDLNPHVVAHNRF